MEPTNPSNSTSVTFLFILDIANGPILWLMQYKEQIVVNCCLKNNNTAAMQRTYVLLIAIIFSVWRRNCNCKHTYHSGNKQCFEGIPLGIRVIMWIP